MAHAHEVNLPASGKSVTLYVDWTEATSVQQIKSGIDPNEPETLLTSMGKIAKWKTEFKKLVFTDLSISSGTAETGKAITALSYNTSTGVITATKGTFLTAHPSTSTQTDTTSEASPAHGGTFTTVDSVTRDSYGHVTKINTKTVTLPSDQNTDTKVTQTNTTNDADYRVLFSANANNTTETTTSRKSGDLIFNPSTKVLSTGRLSLKSTTAPAITVELGSLAPTAGQNVNVLTVKFKNTDGTKTHTVSPIAIIGNDATGDSATYNSGVRLGSTNGTTIVAAGDSSTTFAAAKGKYNDENLYLVADASVLLYRGMSNDSAIGSGPWTVGGFTETPTSGQVIIADGTVGGYKTSGYTIAKSVPSNALFTDHITTATTSGSGNAVTAITADADGALTVTKGSTFSLSTHTHNYAGSSSAGGAATSANKLNTDAGGVIKPVYFSNGVPVACNAPASGAWWNTVSPVNSSGVLEIGRYIDFHCTSASTNNYDVRLDAGASAKSLIVLCAHETEGPWLTVQGKLPKLKFIQTTSGYEYNRDTCGITAYPGSYDAGLNLIMQSGGNTIIGSGEIASTFMTSLNDGDRSDINKYPYYWKDNSERAYLAADENAYIWTNGASWDSTKKYFLNLHCFIFSNSGNFALPVGGAIYYRYGTRDANTGMVSSFVQSGLVSAATTTARTWTLPDATGTIALKEVSVGTSYIKSRDTAGIYANSNAATSSSLFYTAVFVKTNTGGWSIGTLPSNDKLYFVWTTDANYNNNNNSYTAWTIDSDGLFNGTATSAEKLKTARTIELGNDLTGSASFDGSSNITISAGFYRINANGNGKTNYPWHRFGYIENKPATNSDTDAVFLIVSKYNGGNFGILKASFRINAASENNPATCQGSVRWLVRSGYAEDDACIAWRGVVSGETIYADLFLKCLAWPRTTIYQMSGNRGWTLIYSNETSDTTATDKKASVEVYSTIETAATEIHNKAYSSISYSSQYGNVSTSKKLIDGTGTALSVGSATQPIYFSNGVPTATTYALNKTVPSDAVFTDHITTATTSGSGNAVTAISASNGALTVTKGSTFSLSTHTHNSLVSVPLTGEQLPVTAGNFFFKGSGTSVIGTSTADWVGIQADSGADRFQIVGNSNHLMYRQNDNTTVTASNWNNWVGLMSPSCVTSDTGITVTPTTTTLGTGEGALTYNSGIKISHSNSITAVTTVGMLKVKYDAQGHITGSSAFASADVSTLLNLLGTGSSTPVDADYYISQYANGGTTTTTYHRRPVSALWTYMKGKADSVYAPLSHTHAAGDVTSGTFGVARGGTGRSTLTANAILTGNTTSAINMIATASGALYATAANGAASFGTLPIAQGGTGKTTALEALTNLGGPSIGSVGVSIGATSSATKDLNNYTTPGTYYSADSTVSSYISNGPTTGSGYKLFVAKGYGSNNRIWQIASGNSVGNIWFRFCADVSASTPSWSDWKRICYSDHTHSNYLGASKDSTSYYGMTDPDGTDTHWIRTTTQGIIPYQSGNAGSGHQQLGTSTWYFAAAYIDTIYENGTSLANKYIPKAGATDISGSLETNSTSAGFIVPGANGRKMSLMAGAMTFTIGTSNWASGINFYKTSVLGQIGAHGTGTASSGTCDYFFMGRGYNDYSMRLENDDAGKMTLRGTSPQLKFQQTTTNKTFDNDNAGIIAHPASTNGMNMTIQSNGNMIIGAGEYPTNFYSASKSNSTTYPDYWSDDGEQMYVGSDNNVIIHTNANTIANRKGFMFTTAGNLQLAEGGGILFKYATSTVEHKLTSAATTTARTWTLPNATGTIALTSNIPSTYAGSTTAGGAATTVTITNTENTSEVSKAIPFHDDSTGGPYSLLTNDGLGYRTLNGTASALGISRIVIGNATATGTAGNKYGVVRIYSRQTYYADIRTSTSYNGNRTFTLPNKNGTVAVTGAGTWQNVSSVTDSSAINTYDIKYRKGDASAVEIRGSIKFQTLQASYSLTTLPSEYRPDIDRVFPIMDPDTGGYKGRLRITSAGVVTLQFTAPNVLSTSVTYYFSGMFTV